MLGWLHQSIAGEKEFLLSLLRRTKQEGRFYYFLYTHIGTVFLGGEPWAVRLGELLDDFNGHFS